MIAAGRVVVACVLGLTAAACGGGDDAAGDDGPLALVEQPPSGDDASIEGTLQVTDTCVTLRTDEEDVLLVWPAETSWDAGDREVVIGPDGAVRLGDGADVAISGGGRSAEGGGDWVEDTEWAREPDPSCPSEVGWFVGEVTPTG